MQKNRIIDLPAGYTTRAATMDDAQIVTDLLNAESMDTIGITYSSYEECVQEWTEPGFDLANNTFLILTPDQQLVGFAEIWDNDPIPVKPFCLWAVHPDFRHNGIGEALLNFGERRAAQAIERVPQDAQVSMMCAAFRTDSYGINLLESYGMSVERSFYRMVIELGDYQIRDIEWPAGLRLVTYDQFPNPKQVYLAIFEAFNDHFGSVEEEDPEEGYAAWAHRLSDPEFDPSLWFILLDGDEIAGLSMCWPKANEQKDLGLVRNLGVRRPWRRRGLASKLLDHSFNVFKERDRFRQVHLSVDAESLTGATELYKKVGMHIERENVAFKKVIRPGREMAKT